MDRIPFNPYDFFGYLASGFLALVGMQFIIGFPSIIGHEFKVIDGIMLLLAVYVTGQILATPAKAILEDFMVGRLLGRPDALLLKVSRPMIRGFLFPNFYRPLPAKTYSDFLRKLESDGVQDKDGEDLFLHVRFSSIIRNDEKLMGRLTGFLNQYGFNRNLAFTSLIVGLALIVKWRLTGDTELMKYGISALIAGILLVHRYLKFFRQYSYELFNSYARH